MIIDAEFNPAARIPTDICIKPAVEPERCGLGSIRRSDSNSRNPIVLLKAMALCTPTVKLGSAIHYLDTRSPVMTILQATTISQISSEQLTVGLGVSSRTEWQAKARRKQDV